MKKVLDIARGGALVIEMLWSTSSYLPAHNNGSAGCKVCNGIFVWWTFWGLLLLGPSAFKSIWHNPEDILDRWGSISTPRGLRHLI